MSTSTIIKARLEGVYSCGGCRNQEVFGVDDPMTDCACGASDWNCWIDDNVARDAAYIPLCFMHGTMSFVFVTYDDVPTVGHQFNIRLKSRLTYFEGDERHNEERYYIDGRFEVSSAKEYSLNGHDAVIVGFVEVGLIDATEFVYQPVAGAW